jgi:hypothetical protein
MEAGRIEGGGEHGSRVVAELVKRGQHVRKVKYLGAAQAVGLAPDGQGFIGAADPRVHGVALAWYPYFFLILLVIVIVILIDLTQKTIRITITIKIRKKAKNYFGKPAAWPGFPAAPDTTPATDGTRAMV